MKNDGLMRLERFEEQARAAGAAAERRRIRRAQARIVKLLRKFDLDVRAGGFRRANMAAALRYAAHDLDAATRAPRARRGKR